MRIKRWTEQRGFFVIVSELWYGEWKGVDYAAAALAGDGSTGFGVCAQPPNLQGQSLKTEGPVVFGLCDHWFTSSSMGISFAGMLLASRIRRPRSRDAAGTAMKRTSAVTGRVSPGIMSK